MSDALTLEQFTAHLARALALDPEAISTDADLRAELGLDSIQLFLLLVAIEDLGVTVPEQLFGQLVTIEDAYHHYRTVAGHA
jgi:acyl carrier protein